MTGHSYLSKQINELQQELMKMGGQVEAILTLAFEALTNTDSTLTQQVFSQDAEINAIRHRIEQKTVTLMATQQPTAVDLRNLISILTMSIDLERMGDQAKNIAKAVSFLSNEQKLPLMGNLKKMADLGIGMLQDSLIAYQNDDIDLAKQIAEKDDALDQLFASTHVQIIARLDRGKDTHDAQIGYEVLRVAQTLERFGDLVTNLAERVIYKVTSKFTEINLDSATGA